MTGIMLLEGGGEQSMGTVGGGAWGGKFVSGGHNSAPDATPRSGNGNDGLEVVVAREGRHRDDAGQGVRNWEKADPPSPPYLLVLPPPTPAIPAGAETRPAHRRSPDPRPPNHVTPLAAAVNKGSLRGLGAPPSSTCGKRIAMAQLLASGIAKEGLLHRTARPCVCVCVCVFVCARARCRYTLRDVTSFLLEGGHCTSFIFLPRAGGGRRQGGSCGRDGSATRQEGRQLPGRTWTQAGPRRAGLGPQALPGAAQRSDCVALTHGHRPSPSISPPHNKAVIGTTALFLLPSDSPAPVFPY
ncbi:hypothetical protein E2C01_068897 [Portunus trituberculatus]|uniref:Uncharacterized protein n=1 Tax=Portunus trituberculatus TaxID=210409 RepID=A0A5B7HZ57_PORTR|nr:hypothetical protein [Portunus trituberculatus]